MRVPPRGGGRLAGTATYSGARTDIPHRPTRVAADGLHHKLGRQHGIVLSRVVFNSTGAAQRLVDSRRQAESDRVVTFCHDKNHFVTIRLLPSVSSTGCLSARTALYPGEAAGMAVPGGSR